MCMVACKVHREQSMVTYIVCEGTSVNQPYHLAEVTAFQSNLVKAQSVLF